MKHKFVVALINMNDVNGTISVKNWEVVKVKLRLNFLNVMMGIALDQLQSQTIVADITV